MNLKRLFTPLPIVGQGLGIWLLFAFIFIASSCAKAEEGYRIYGTSEGVVAGDTVYLCEMQGFFSMVPIDTAFVDKDGKTFFFSGNFDGASHRYILPIHKGKAVAWGPILLENADIHIQIFAGENKPAKVEGGPAAKLYAEYEAGNEVYGKQEEEPWNVVRDSTASKEAKDKAQAVVDSIEKLRQAYTKKFIMDHIPSAVSDYLYAMHERSFTEAEKQEALVKMDQGHHYYYYKLYKAEQAAQAATAVGQKYTDLAMADPDGKTIRVSDYVSKNKYTLVDFWASWCGPCRAEMPNVVKAYDLYHAKGFEVVGVSFDNNKEAWVKALTTLKMPWPQMSDLKGWGCAAAPVYNVKGIPANVLIDSNGNIVAKNLRGEELQTKLAELLK